MNFSPVISAAATANSSTPVAISLVIEPGLAKRHDSLRDITKTGIYQHGLSRMAAELGVPAGNLCNQVNGTGQRHLSVDSLERYIERTGDVRPIHYLIDRYLLTQERQHADARAVQLMSQIQALLGSNGIR